MCGRQLDGDQCRTGHTTSGQLMADILWQQKEDGAVLPLLLQQRRRWRRPRHFWVRTWIGRRLDFGQYHNVMTELEWEHNGDFTNYMRMDRAMFHELLQRLSLRLMKKNTNCWAALQPGLKLAITLRFLAIGATYHSLSFTFRVPHNTISLFVSEVLQAIVD